MERRENLTTPPQRALNYDMCWCGMSHDFRLQPRLEATTTIGSFQHKIPSAALAPRGCAVHRVLTEEWRGSAFPHTCTQCAASDSPHQTWWPAHAQIPHKPHIHTNRHTIFWSTPRTSFRLMAAGAFCWPQLLRVGIGGLLWVHAFVCDKSVHLVNVCVCVCVFYCSADPTEEATSWGTNRELDPLPLFWSKHTITHWVLNWL